MEESQSLALKADGVSDFVKVAWADWYQQLSRGEQKKDSLVCPQSEPSSQDRLNAMWLQRCELLSQMRFFCTQTGRRAIGLWKHCVQLSQVGTDVWCSFYKSSLNYSEGENIMYPQVTRANWNTDRIHCLRKLVLELFGNNGRCSPMAPDPPAAEGCSLLCYKESTQPWVPVSPSLGLAFNEFLSWSEPTTKPCALACPNSVASACGKASRLEAGCVSVPRLYTKKV